MTRKILVIDDEEDLCNLIKLNLESAGEFKVTMAFSGEEGIAKAQQEKFDLAITDFNMPDMNGEEVIDNLKQINPSLPVLLFSIYHDDNPMFSSNIKKKLSGIISKPIDHSQLCKTINDVLNKQ
ncbi:MAG: response regulator [Candidatus Omnitrophota bacterium]